MNQPSPPQQMGSFERFLEREQYLLRRRPIIEPEKGYRVMEYAPERMILAVLYNALATRPNQEVTTDASTIVQRHRPVHLTSALLESLWEDVIREDELLHHIGARPKSTDDLYGLRNDHLRIESLDIPLETRLEPVEEDANEYLRLVHEIERTHAAAPVRQDERRALRYRYALNHQTIEGLICALTEDGPRERAYARMLERTIAPLRK